MLEQVPSKDAKREAFAFDILEGSSQELRQVSFLSKCRPLKEGTQNGHNIRRIYMDPEITEK